MDISFQDDVTVILLLGVNSQSNELTRGTTELVQHSALSFIGGVHIGARVLLDINLIWFGYIAF